MRSMLLLLKTGFLLLFLKDYEPIFSEKDDYGIYEQIHQKDYDYAEDKEKRQFQLQSSREDEQKMSHHHPNNNGYHQGSAKGKRNCSTQIVIIDKLLNGTGYNKFRLPSEDGVEVSIEFWIQAITSISEITNDFEMDIYIKNYLGKLQSSCKRTNFPMDIQTCHLVYERHNLSTFSDFSDSFSFNYNNQEVRMRWNPFIENPVYTLGPIVLPDFNLVDINEYLVVEPYPAGMWDELHVKLTFERRYIWYFMQAYVPAYLTIFISLGCQAIPARTMLGVNALLAIDVWMLGAMTFIFCSLLELAIVGFKVRETGNTNKQKKKHPPILCKKISSGLVEISPNFGEKRFLFSVETGKSSFNNADFCRSSHFSIAIIPKSLKLIVLRIGEMQPEEIDKISSVAFPTLFATFNIIYWAFYGRRAAEATAQLMFSEKTT